ncbi:MAG TPA: bifunctional metallophosphatase/5'-nucleotidase [Pseudogracilibacillus sp.]|nr:bifunctional metallophosphatase/5'-nucleotidase [Pseudogracilibacillus sp.]
MTSLTFLQINDVHAYLELHEEVFIEHGQETYRQAGGYARIASLIKEIKKEVNHDVLLFDNGDTFHGTYPVVTSKGEAIVPILNELPFLAMTGHWDFAYGPKQLKHLVSQLDYPFLANNCFKKETNELLFPAHLMIEKSGVKIGVIGIASPIIDKLMPKHFSEGIYFTNGDEHLSEQISELKNQNADLIVVLSHLGFPQETKLAEEVEGIDIILSGHTHNRFTEPAIVNDTLIIQSGCHGSHLGKLTIEVSNGKVKSHQHELIEIAESIIPDKKVDTLIQNTLKEYRPKLNRVIGETLKPLNRNAQLETTMDKLLLSAISEAAETPIAFSNGWRYGAPITPGPVTVNDLYNIIPTNPPVSKVTLTGEEILNMLEENIENTFAKNPYDQKGGYLKRMHGIDLYIKLENAKGLRIKHLYINKEPIIRDKLYDVAFVTVQGVPAKYGTDRRNLDVSAIDALINWIEKRGTFTIDEPNHVKLI